MSARLRVVAALVLASSAASGCSYLALSQVPGPSEHLTAPPDCISGRLAPALDTGITAALLAVATLLLVEDLDQPVASDIAPTAVPFVFAGLSAASAAYGFRETSRCAAAKAAFAAPATPPAAAP